MAEKVENVNGISAFGARASKIMSENTMPMMTGLDTRSDARKLPLLVDTTNKSATRAIEKKGIATAVRDTLGNNANINIAYDLRDDLAAVDEERRYRAAVTFMQWIIQTYNDDAFSMHTMFTKHPFLKQMVEQSIDYWCDLVRKMAVAKLLPRTMWDEGVENILFKCYTMEPDARKGFLEFIQSNPFFSQDYPQKDPIRRGPYSMRSILGGVPNSVKALDNSFLRAIAGGADGVGPKFTTDSIANLFRTGASARQRALVVDDLLQ